MQPVHHLLHEGACCGVRLVGAVSGTLDKCGCRESEAVAVGPARHLAQLPSREPYSPRVSAGCLLSPAAAPRRSSSAVIFPASPLAAFAAGAAPQPRAGRPRPRTGLRLSVPGKADYRMADVREQNSAWVRRRERHMRCRIEVLPPDSGEPH